MGGGGLCINLVIGWEEAQRVDRKRDTDTEPEIFVHILKTKPFIMCFYVLVISSSHLI